MGLSIKDIKSKIKRFLVENASLVVLFVLCVVFLFIDSSLFSVRNIRNILSITAPRLIVACAFAFCLYLGILNISLAFFAGLAGIFAASFFQTPNSTSVVFSSFPSIPVSVVVIVVILVMCLVSLLHVLLIRTFSFSFILSNLGIIALLYGFAHVYLHNSEKGLIYLDAFSVSFRKIATASIGSDPTYSLPVSVIVSVFICIGLWIARFRISALKTLFNQKPQSNMHDSNEKMPLFELVLVLFISTAVASFGGIMQVSYTGYVDSEFGLNYLFDIIVICLISGFSIFGGKGRLPFLIIGSFVYTAFCYTVDYVGLERYIPSIIIRAVVIIICIITDIYFYQCKAKQVEINSMVNKKIETEY
ncbi:MAG TPA: hypothetical protein VFC68_02740 [Treponemataceae bacterium]|nr:hypothetical protein [Treponemataceae bacterium]